MIIIYFVFRNVIFCWRRLYHLLRALSLCVVEYQVSLFTFSWYVLIHCVEERESWCSFF